MVYCSARSRSSKVCGSPSRRSTESINTMDKTSPVTSPTSASTYQDPRDLGVAADTANASEIPAVDGDPIVNLFHTLLGHLPSGRFETRPDCKAFISGLARTRGLDLSLILGIGTKQPEEADDLIMRLRGLGITDVDLGPDSTAEYISSQAEAKFEALLSSIRPALGELALGKLGLIPWTLYQHGGEVNASEDTIRHLDNLGLPQTGRSGIPSLLLHGLGIKPKHETVDNLLNFTNVDHKYFINAAGSGKTRLCLEAMCKKYGFYFTCADPRGTLSNAFADVRKAHEIGSYDLSNVFKALADSYIPTSQQNLSLLPEQSLNAMAERSRMETGMRNTDKARRLLRRVLTVRLVLLAEYLALAHTYAVIDTMDSRRAWMHLQVQPHILCLHNSDDVFASLAEELRRASETYVTNRATASLKRIATLLHPDRDQDVEFLDLKIPTVIDEAQEGLFQLPNAFLSPTAKDKSGYFVTRPFLREVTAHWSTFHSDRCNVQFIVTGTGLSLNHLREKINSSLAKTEVWKDAEFMESFRYRKEQRAYLHRYLPSSLLKSPHGKVLLARIWYWLRGRHRFTASFVQYLLGCAVFDGYRANVLLNMYIWGLAHFHPMDATSQGYPMNLPGIPHPSHTSIEFEKLDSRCISTLRFVVYRYVLRGLKPSSFEDVTESLLRVGLGQLVGLAEKSSKVEIYEPLIFMAAFTWLNKLAHRRVSADPGESFFVEPLFCFITDHLKVHAPGWNMFENLLAYYFSQVFSASTQSRLSEVFTFPRADTSRNGKRVHSPPSEAELELGSCRATLVSFYSRKGIHLEGSFDYPPTPTRAGETPGYPGTIGVSAKDSVHVFKSPTILRHKTKSPASILFPGIYMGPDLLFMLRLENEGHASTYLWVAVQAKLRTAASVSGRELLEAIDSVTPKNFFTSRKNNSAKKDARKQEDKFAEHMLEHGFNEKTLSALEDGLPKGKATPNAGTYSLLRVVAQFPRLLNLKSVFDRDEDSKHPLVSLDTENLERTTQQQFPPYALRRLQREALKRSRKDDETPDESEESDDDSEVDLDIHDVGVVDSDNERPRKRMRQDNEEDTAEGDESEGDESDA
ncbi:hypothetical protein BDZ89DRAFT_1156186 [Hymenopellis radicata]|nr:hypothetical protein BDZ89DRAFT_1156186 [Hymenopellis radicata]